MLRLLSIPCVLRTCCKLLGIAELMRQVLDTAGDRDDALARFVGSVSPEDVQALRRALDGR